MIRFLRIVQVSLALALTLLIFVQVQKSCRAQEPEPNVPPSLSIVKSLGYKPKPVTPESMKGEAIFKDLNCMACHSIHGVGGDLAPVLDAVGQRRSSDFLLAHLSNSEEEKKKYDQLSGIDATGRFPHTRIKPDSAKLIADFLLTLPEPVGGFVITPHTVRTPAEEPPPGSDFHPSVKNASSEKGAKLYNDFGCVACHSIGQIGGWLGPRLDGVGGRHTRSYIVAHINNANIHSENGSRSNMPKFNASSDQVEKIADFLMTLPKLK